MSDQYALCHNCVLCEVINTSVHDREIQDTFLDGTDHFQWVPALGSFIEGYSLIISKKHLLNTGCLDIHVIKELESFINKIQKRLKTIYKINSIVFEHGSMGKNNYAGSCIDHHHIHVVPLELTQTPEILGNNFISLGQIHSMKELVRFNQNKIPYIYFSNSSGKNEVFEAPILPRQYLRQVIAAQCDLKDWDWREKPFLKNINRFVNKVRKLKNINIE